MLEFYKLLFDLTLCYELFGYYFKIMFRVEPCLGGFLLLLSMILLDVFLRSRDAKHGFLKYLPLLLPIAVFYYRPSLWQIVQILPIWAYIGYSIYYDRIGATYDEFMSHFAFAGKIQFILILGIVGWDRIPGALLVAIPYLVMMLAIGVCMLRMLREKENAGTKQAIIVAVFILVSALLTLGKAPQLLVSCIGFIYSKAIAPILMGAAMVVTSVAYVFVIALRWLLTVIRKEEPKQAGTESPPAWYDASRNYEITPVNVEWLKYVIIFFAVVLVAGVIFLILRKMLSDGSEGETSVGNRDETEKIEVRRERTKGIFGTRPRNPRLAVRYYYGKFLNEVEKRMPERPEGLTASELSAAAGTYFPGVDPSVLAAIYSPARYSSREAVTAEDADRAAAAWKELKHTKLEKNVK